jgi:O-antigen/teichoic acid export membrane protein
MSILMKNQILHRLIAHARLPLFRNGYALMVSAATTSGLGVVYWMLATRSYPAEVVGMNSAIISAMLLVSGIAQLSLLSVMARFLPRAGQAAGRLVATAYALTLTVAAVAGLAFVVGINTWAPALAFLGSSPLVALWFTLATMMWCIFTLQDSVLAGLNQTVWVPIENTIFAIAKIVLLLSFAVTTAQFGIFASWTIPGLVVVLPISYLIFRRLLPQHARATHTRAEALVPRQIARYAASNYAGSLLSLATTTLLPLLIIHELGPSANAYFAQPWLIASSLQLVAGNMAVSLTVEGSADRAQLASYTWRTLTHTARLLVPLVAVVVLGAPYVLQLFGADYAAQGTDMLRLLALGALPNLVTMIYLSATRVQNRVGAIVLVQGTLCALTLGLSLVLLRPFGITGVGAAWFASQLIVAAAIGLAHASSLPRRNTAYAHDDFDDF